MLCRMLPFSFQGLAFVLAFALILAFAFAFLFALVLALRTNGRRGL